MVRTARPIAMRSVRLLSFRVVRLLPANARLQPRRLSMSMAVVGCKPMLCRRFSGHYPAWKYQHAWMALERAREHLRPLHAKAYSVVLNG